MTLMMDETRLTNDRQYMLVRFLLEIAQLWMSTVPNVYKSCPKMISQEKLKLLKPLQKIA